jgi:hypothetical protein
MTKWMPRIAALVVFQGGALFAQSLTGAWQGTIAFPQVPGGQMRLVFKIATTDADTLKADMYNVDAGGHIAASEVTLKGSTVKIVLSSIQSTYVAKLSADGNSISGSWTGPDSVTLTLNLVRTTPETAWTIPEPPPPPKMMDEKAKPQFEVATIKTVGSQPARLGNHGEPKRHAEHAEHESFGPDQIRL